MMIPAFLFGRYGAVASRCKTIAKRVVTERSADVIQAGPMLDTLNTTGLILLGKDLTVAHQDNFHGFALNLAILEAVPHDAWLQVTDAWLRWSFVEPWRFLCTYSREAAYLTHRNGSLLKPYVETAIKFWPIFEAEGRRYGPCQNGEPCDAWTVNSGLQFALARFGVSTQELLAPPPPNGLSAFLSRIKAS